MDEEGSSGSSKIPYSISFITEFIGTGLLMYIGCMSCVWEFGMGPTIPAFAFGLVILAIIQIFGHISPVHINPAVTLASFIMGKMDWKRGLVYVCAQYTGALAGTLLLKMMMPYTPYLCLLKVNVNITVTQGFFIEFMATFVLFMTVAGATDPKNASKEDSLPLRLGLAIAGLVFAAGDFTGAGLNPARALAPALIARSWNEQWLYQFGPYAGMATAALIYRFVLDSKGKSFYKFAEKKGL